MVSSSLVLSSNEDDWVGLPLVLLSNEDGVIGSSLVLSSNEGDGLGLLLVLSSNEDGVIGSFLVLFSKEYSSVGPFSFNAGLEMRPKLCLLSSSSLFTSLL